MRDAEIQLEPLPADTPRSDHLLDVRDLHTVFHTEAGIVRAVDGVSFTVEPREVFAIVGESGSGKTVTALSILGLIPEPAGKITSGQILYNGEDLVTMDRERRRQIRGDRIAMIFQDPLTALNPVYRVGQQIAEVIRAHRDVSGQEASDRAIELLATVGIPNPKMRSRDYPHQFSGGMRQRAMIAMAIANDPDLLIADEPTTALDVTIQAQILEVLLDIRERFNTAVILITHDLGVVAEAADRVMVMYAAKRAEEADVRTLYSGAKHPYTWGLLSSVTRTDAPRAERLFQIPGAPPSLIHPPEACRFAPRCSYVQPICRDEYPVERLTPSGTVTACHFSTLDGWAPSWTPADLVATLNGAPPPAPANGGAAKPTRPRRTGTSRTRKATGS
jgi:oligopeptide/dipeptide ABC transporter ATP-binding protein